MISPRDQCCVILPSTLLNAEHMNTEHMSASKILKCFLALGLISVANDLILFALPIETKIKQIILLNQISHGNALNCLAVRLMGGYTTSSTQQPALVLRLQILHPLSLAPSFTFCLGNISIHLHTPIEERL